MACAAIIVKSRASEILKTSCLDGTQILKRPRADNFEGTNKSDSDKKIDCMRVPTGTIQKKGDLWK